MLLRRHTTPQRNRLPNRASFLVGYERVSRRNLLSNMMIRRTRTIAPRNRWTRKNTKRVRIVVDTPPQKIDRKIVEKYRNQRRKKAKTSGSLLGNIANGVANLEGIKHATELYKSGTSKITSKNVRKVLDSDVANYIVEETQKKAKEDLNNLFGGV